MLMKKPWVRLYLLFSLIVLSYVASPVFAQQTSQSTNYKFVEPSLGGTGLLQSQSANYQAAGAAAGILGVGNSSSSNYQINTGNITTNDPALTFAITSPNATFDDFSAAQAATATSTFEVTNYTSYGYIVQIVGDPPKYGTHTIAPMGTPTPEVSQAGVEQFGINVVANTSPVSFGANPTCSPDNSFCPFSSLVNLIPSDYKTPNNYRYVDGETIASAPKSSGKISYTISYLVNVSSVTPAGQYTSNQTLICTGTY